MGSQKSLARASLLFPLIVLPQWDLARLEKGKYNPEYAAVHFILQCLLRRNPELLQCCVMCFFL